MEVISEKTVQGNENIQIVQNYEKTNDSRIQPVILHNNENNTFKHELERNQEQFPVIENNSTEKLTSDENKMFTVLTMYATEAKIWSQVTSQYNDLFIGLYIALDNTSFTVQELKAKYILIQAHLTEVLQGLEKLSYYEQFIRFNKETQEKMQYPELYVKQLGVTDAIVQILFDYITHIMEENKQPVLSEILTKLEKGLGITLGRERTRRLRKVEQIVKVIVPENKKTREKIKKEINERKHNTIRRFIKWKIHSIVNDFDKRIKEADKQKQNYEVKNGYQGDGQKRTDSEKTENNFSKKRIDTEFEQKNIQQERGFLYQQPSVQYQTTFMQVQQETQNYFQILLERLTMEIVMTKYPVEVPSAQRCIEENKKWTKEKLLQITPIEKRIERLLIHYTDLHKINQPSYIKGVYNAAQLVTDGNITYYEMKDLNQLQLQARINQALQAISQIEELQMVEQAIKVRIDIKQELSILQAAAIQVIIHATFALEQLIMAMANKSNYAMLGINITKETSLQIQEKAQRKIKYEISQAHEAILEAGIVCELAQDYMKQRFPNELEKTINTDGIYNFKIISRLIEDEMAIFRSAESKLLEQGCIMTATTQVLHYEWNKKQQITPPALTLYPENKIMNDNTNLWFKPQTKSTSLNILGTPTPTKLGRSNTPSCQSPRTCIFDEYQTTCNNMQQIQPSSFNINPILWQKPQQYQATVPVTAQKHARVMMPNYGFEEMSQQNQSVYENYEGINNTYSLYNNQAYLFNETDTFMGNGNPNQTNSNQFNYVSSNIMNNNSSNPQNDVYTSTTGQKQATIRKPRKRRFKEANDEQLVTIDSGLNELARENQREIETIDIRSPEKETTPDIKMKSNPRKCRKRSKIQEIRDETPFKQENLTNRINSDTEDESSSTSSSGINIRNKLGSVSSNTSQSTNSTGNTPQTRYRGRINTKLGRGKHGRTQNYSINNNINLKSGETSESETSESDSEPESDKENENREPPRKRRKRCKPNKEQINRNEDDDSDDTERRFNILQLQLNTDSTPNTLIKPSTRTHANQHSTPDYNTKQNKAQSCNVFTLINICVYMIKSYIYVIAALYLTSIPINFKNKKETHYKHRLATQDKPEKTQILLKSKILPSLLQQHQVQTTFVKTAPSTALSKTNRDRTPFFNNKSVSLKQTSTVEKIKKEKVINQRSTMSSKEKKYGKVFKQALKKYIKSKNESRKHPIIERVIQDTILAIRYATVPMQLQNKTSKQIALIMEQLVQAPLTKFRNADYQIERTERNTLLIYIHEQGLTLILRLPERINGIAIQVIMYDREKSQQLKVGNTVTDLKTPNLSDETLIIRQGKVQQIKNNYLEGQRMEECKKGVLGFRTLINNAQAIIEAVESQPDANPSTQYATLRKYKNILPILECSTHYSCENLLGGGKCYIPKQIKIPKEFGEEKEEKTIRKTRK